MMLYILSLKCSCNDIFSIQLSSKVPAKYSGMRLIIPSEIYQEEYKNSRTIAKETTNKIMCNEIHFEDNRVSTAKIKSDIKNQKKKLNDAKLQEVTNNTSCKTKLRSIEASTEYGASIWLTVIPVIRNVFFLEKQAFW